jgi:acyl dehydratase
MSHEPSSLDLASFTTWRRGNKYQDFSIGQEFEHHWGRTLTEADNVVFSSATCNWSPLHLNVEYARAHGHPSAPMNPYLVLCTVVGLSVEDLSEAGGPFLGLENCEFLAPVYAGDTLRTHSTVLAMRESQSRPHNGTVTWRTEAHNQHSELVLRLERTNLIAKRRDVS